MVEKTLEISLLYDFYGELLTQRQKSILQYYYEDNYTLGEIAEETGISRQAVHDAVHKAERSLHSYEEKLGFLRRFRQKEADIGKAQEAIDQIMADYSENKDILDKLMSVRNILSSLEE